MVAREEHWELLNFAQDAADQTASVEILPRKERRQRPDRWEYVFSQAMRDTGVHVHGDALRLCLGYACGELESLCLVLDDPYTRSDKDKKRLVPSLVGVWKVDPPGNAVVWFEDGTGDVDLLHRLTGREVLNQTPPGRLPWTVPPLQYPEDVTRSTSPNIVRGLLRGVLARYPDARKVGLITLRQHLKALAELQPFWRERIVDIDYFGSGNDRASNAWLNSDLLVILGTPRVPPSAMRQALIQIGDLEAARQNGEWTGQAWTGRTTTGALVYVNSLGYKNTAWDRVHRMLVRDALIQAIGRGRPVTEKGIPVIVLSNESLDLPLAPFHLAPNGFSASGA